MMKIKPAIALLGIAALLQGCVSLLPPDNEAISKIDKDNGYRIQLGEGKGKPIGEHNVILAFSGGGTRAAALSYGVMQALRDTRIDSHGQSQGQQVRLLDEVDRISSVSGGSFTSAYYGLYGDDLFRNYESDFLRKSVQSSLVRKPLNNSNFKKFPRDFSLFPKNQAKFSAILL